MHKSSTDTLLASPWCLCGDVFSFPLTCTLRCSVRGNKIMQQPIYKGLPLLSPSANSFSEHTECLGIIWSHNKNITPPFFLFICSSEAVAEMMMAMMIIIILIFKARLLVLLCMSGIYDPLQEEPQSKALKEWQCLSPSSLRCLPTPASPCHALLEEAAKWASDVPPEERARWVAQA